MLNNQKEAIKLKEKMKEMEKENYSLHKQIVKLKGKLLECKRFITKLVKEPINNNGIIIQKLQKENYFLRSTLSHINTFSMTSKSKMKKRKTLNDIQSDSENLIDPNIDIPVKLLIIKYNFDRRNRTRNTDYFCQITIF